MLHIADQNLRDESGHSYEYTLIAAQEAGAARVLAHARCRIAAIGGAQVVPWFSSSLKQAPLARRRGARGWLRALAAQLPAPWLRRIQALRGRGPAAGAGGAPAFPTPTDRERAREFTVELARYAGLRMARGDRLLLHSVTWLEVAECLEAARPGGPLAGVVVDFVLRWDPPSRGADRARLTAAARAGGGHARWFADTQELCAAYAELLPATVAQCVIPVMTAPLLALRVDRRDAAPVFGYLGEARREKGFHLLPQALAALDAPPLAEAGARMLAQAHYNIRGGEPGLNRVLRALRRHRRVTLAPGVLSGARFHALLAESDIILLPYDADIYRLRSSGILIAAIAAGRCVVAPGRGWLRTAIEAEGWTDRAAFMSGPDDLGRAMQEAFAKWRAAAPPAAASPRHASLYARPWADNTSRMQSSAHGGQT